MKGTNKSNIGTALDMNDILYLGDSSSPVVRYFRQTIPVTVHHFYITTEIGEASDYLDMIQTMKTAEAHDTIFVYLNSVGGSLTTAIAIISAMRNSNATIITCLEGEVCSAATMIFLSGSKFLVNPNCTFMIHNYSGGTFGKGHEIVLQNRYMSDYIKKLMYDIYGGFLTDAEIEEVLEGKDLWLGSDDVLERLGHRASNVKELDVQKILAKLPGIIEQLLTDGGDDVPVEEVVVMPPAKKRAPAKKEVKTPPKKK